MEEIWRDIKGFEGLYQVSNMGRVKSFRKSKKLCEPEEYILKNYSANNGYLQVYLYGHKKRKAPLVHRLVAEAFVPNPNNYPHVNHKDENRSNNVADNLEWCTAAYNNEYGTAKIRAAITHGAMVEQYLPNGVFLAKYACVSVASKITGVPDGSIQKCASGKVVSGGGYIWKYAK